MVIAAAAAAVLAGTVALVTSRAGNAASPRANAAALRAQEHALEQRARGALLDLYAVEIRVSRARADSTALRSRAERLALERGLLRRRAEAVRQSLAAAQARLGRTLRTLYQYGQTDPIAILLGAASIDEAVEGIDGLRRAAKANRRLVEDLRRKQAQVRVLTAQLQARDRDLAAARQHADGALRQLEGVMQARLGTLASLRARGNLTRRQVARLDALARQAERRSAELAAQAKHATVLAATVQTGPTPKPTAAGTHTLVVDAVAYHLPGRTASGLPVGPGVVAVDPTVIPLGTRMFVPGYGPAVAADVGSAVKGDIIDLWMPSRAQALAWGRRTVTITLYG
jgi:3D (Asp-Asp-Asp) domain-containing protein